MRTVLVTGGTRGIGRAVVELLAPTWRVVIGGRDPQAVADLVALYPHAQGFVADLADADAVRAAVAQLGEVDAVVHSAGTVAYGAAETQSWEQWRHVLDLNVIAVAELTRLLLGRLREAHGQVVVVTSGAGLHARPGSAVYAASKFALRAWADALRAEEAGTLRVTSVHPGPAWTPTCSEPSRLPKAKSTTPRESWTSLRLPRPLWPSRWKRQRTPAWR